MFYENRELLEQLADGVGLNPCSNGICSMRVIVKRTAKRLQVLILVLMEYVL